MSILLVVHREPHIYTEQVNEHPVGCTHAENLFMTIYTEQVNEHPVALVVHRELASHVSTNSFWCLTDLYITSALERKLKSSPLLRSTCKTSTTL